MKFVYKLLIVAMLFSFTSCEVDEVLNPNAPTVESFENNATLADLKLLAHGLQSIIRVDMNFHFWTLSALGREYYDFRGTDPRYTSELLGRNGGDLDNNGFLTTRTFFGRYRSVRNAILLKTAVENSAASLTSSQANALIGFANTIIGYELLLEANRQYENGMRTNVDDPDNLGPFAGGYQASLDGIKPYLDQGFNQLSGADEDVVFNLVGFETLGVSDTRALAQFNRAVAARLALYQNDNTGALAALNDSFFDLNGDMSKGAYYTFGGATGNDLPNPFFYVPGVDFYMANTLFVTEAEAGDGRLNKVNDTGADVSIDDLSSPYQVTLYPSNTSPASMIRNEELILIYAEANIGSNNTEAINAINAVRSAAGLPDYAGATDDASITEQLIYERRYSLFGEGHRWVDMRRWGRLDEIPLDRPADKMHVQFPRPATEVETN